MNGRSIFVIIPRYSLVMACPGLESEITTIDVLAVLCGLRQDTTDISLILRIRDLIEPIHDGNYFTIAKNALSEDERTELCRNLKRYLPDAPFMNHVNVTGYLLAEEDTAIIIETYSLTGQAELFAWAGEILRTGRVRPQKELLFLNEPEPVRVAPDDVTRGNPAFENTRPGGHLEEDPYGDTRGYRIPATLTR